MQGIPHYMIDEVSIKNPLFCRSVPKKKAFSQIDDLLKDEKLPIVAGGTGLYINSLLYDLDFTQTIKDTAYREELEKTSASNNYMTAWPFWIRKLHSASIRMIKKRLIRRLEILKHGGEKNYEFRKKK